MSVVGVDLGNLRTIIAVARKGGIDVICNEVSNRATPTLVGFSPKTRFIGESAKSQEISNLKNTIGSFKRLMGLRYDDPRYIEELRYLKYRTEPMEDGFVGIKVNYLGEERLFSPMELTAMFLGQIKETTKNELNPQPVHEIVMSCPVYFTHPQRRMLMDAADIAGLKVVSLMNDTTAAAFGYGITKATDLNDETARTVCFVDMGQSNYSVAIASFWKTRMEVKSVAYDQNLGGRVFDEALAEALADEIKQNRKVDVRTSPKTVYRLRLAAERAKMVMSANSKTAIHVESITEDQDYSTDFTRERFEGLIGGLLDRIEAPIHEALKDAGLTPEAIHSVELIGGGVRIPAVKERIAKIFGNREPGSTMNQDEAVARGCALQAAILSPALKARSYALQDAVVVDVKFAWDPSPEDSDDIDAIVFPAGNLLPSTKLLSFERPLPFEITVSCQDNDIFAAAAIGTTAYNLPPGAVLKVKTKMSLCHTVSIESAQIIEETIVVDNPSTEGGEPQKRKVQKKTDVAVTFEQPGLSTKQLEYLREQEGIRTASDKLVRDTAHCRNELEGYIYAARSKVDSDWSACATDQEKQNLHSKLDSTETWLYSEECDDTVGKSVYVDKLNGLKAIGDPICKRHIESEARPKAVSRLHEQVAQYMAFAENRTAKYDHISEDDRNVVKRACADAESTVSGLLAKQANLKPWDKPVITTVMVDSERDKLVRVVTPIMLKPKPAPPTPSPSAQSNSDAKTDSTPPVDDDIGMDL